VVRIGSSLMWSADGAVATKRWEGPVILDRQGGEEAGRPGQSGPWGSAVIFQMYVASSAKIDHLRRCTDRAVATKRPQVAIMTWEDGPKDSKESTGSPAQQ
jgi:hypothetical protein